jgi:hypothetical protein
MNRDEALHGIRPEITIELIGVKNEDEQFMHETLRPILKFQHQLIVQFLKNEQNLPLESLNGKQRSNSEKRTLITNFLQKNNKLKATLLGFAIGMFQQSELATYFLNKKAIDKRIIEMIITRFLSEFTHD